MLAAAVSCPFLAVNFPVIIVITLFSPSRFGQETAKGPFGLRVKLPPVYHTRWRIHTVPSIAERQAGSCEYQFLWPFVCFDRESNPGLPFQEQTLYPLDH